MTFLNRKGVSVIGHTVNTNNNNDLIVRRSFVADEQLVNNDAAWKSRMVSDFLGEVGLTLFEFKGDKGMDYPIQFNEPIVEPFDNDESLHPQVFVKFSAIIAGRKELN